LYSVFMPQSTLFSLRFLRAIPNIAVQHRFETGSLIAYLHRHNL
jgi:hypothetical protein